MVACERRRGALATAGISDKAQVMLGRSISAYKVGRKVWPSSGGCPSGHSYVVWRAVAVTVTRAPLIYGSLIDTNLYNLFSFPKEKNKKEGKSVGSTRSYPHPLTGGSRVGQVGNCERVGVRLDRPNYAQSSSSLLRSFCEYKMPNAISLLFSLRLVPFSREN
ncbi:hypothetical protein SAY86_008595 [Trapa natans]|uniref:Uncharacterized protein n=1 Tax=Trapa natans TaxID=22666 RepID=A0AAN7QB88_TRANT|nr:hypothetical protein SAY86_008595 [Trapa natans]